MTDIDSTLALVINEHRKATAVLCAFLATGKDKVNIGITISDESLDTVQKPAGGGDAHRLLVLVVAQTVGITQRTIRAAEFEVGDEGWIDVPPRLLGDPPTSGD